MLLVNFKNQLIKTPYLVLFIILIAISVGTASALITITLSGNVVVTGDMNVQGNLTGPTINSLQLQGQNPVSVLTGITKNPADGVIERIDIIAIEEGKVFYGHITGTASFPEGNRVFLNCKTEGSFANDLAGDPSQNFAVINSDFVCQELYFSVWDLTDSIDAGQGNIHSVTTYFENSNVITLP